MFQNGQRVRFNWEREEDGAYYRGEGNVERSSYSTGMTWVRVDADTLEIHDPLGTRENGSLRNDGLAYFYNDELEVVE